MKRRWRQTHPSVFCTQFVPFAAYHRGKENESLTSTGEHWTYRTAQKMISLHNRVIQLRKTHSLLSAKTLKFSTEIFCELWTDIEETLSRYSEHKNSNSLTNQGPKRWLEDLQIAQHSVVGFIHVKRHGAPRCVRPALGVAVPRLSVLVKPSRVAVATRQNEILSVEAPCTDLILELDGEANRLERAKEHVSISESGSSSNCAHTCCSSNN